MVDRMSGVTIGIGMDSSLAYRVLRPLYPAHVEGVPYPGLRKFAESRDGLDFAFGAGLPPAGGGLPGLSERAEDVE